MTPKKKPTNLVGQFFHFLGKTGKVEWQGHVIGHPEPGWYYVETLEWLMGEPHTRHLIQIETMRPWLFYPDSEAMVHSYEHGAAREDGPYRSRPPEPVDAPTA